MSTGSLPSHIEPFKWADRGAEVDVTVPLKPFTRLLEGALSDQGNVTVRCDFARDAQGVAYISGQAQTSVSMTCQRCLEPVQVDLDVDFRLLLVSDEARAENLPEDEDFLIVGEETIALQDIVEDELILALPLVAAHDDCDSYSYVQEVPEAEEAPAPKKENPFQVLAGLKGQDSEKK